MYRNIYYIFATIHRFRIRNIIFRCKLEDFDANRRNILAELDEFNSTETFIADAESFIADLDAEKNTHSEIIQQINQV